MDKTEIYRALVIIIPIVSLIGITIGSAIGFTKLFKKHPKSYIWANISLMIYPYAYILGLVIGYLVDKDDGAVMTGILAILAITIHPLIWGTLIADFIAAIKGYLNPKSMASASVIVKSVQIPAYIVHFIFGTFGLLASIWGIGFISFAIVIDLITISFTGAFTTANSIGLCKCNIVTKPIAVVASVLSFIYCVDIPDVIALSILAKKKMKKLG